MITGLRNSITAASLDSAGQLWLLSQAGDVLISHDDGVSFAQFSQTARTPVTGAAFAAATDLVLVGERGVRTLDVE
ncbi:hypothetical protein D3C79_851840 [compost metagenome]